MLWFIGSVVLSYGEFLHATQNLSLAKEIYQKVIQGVAENKDFSDLNAVAACNMSSAEVLLAATCALGQLEAHMGLVQDSLFLGMIFLQHESNFFVF